MPAGRRRTRHPHTSCDKPCDSETPGGGATAWRAPTRLNRKCPKDVHIFICAGTVLEPDFVFEAP